MDYTFKVGDNERLLFVNEAGKWISNNDNGIFDLLVEPSLKWKEDNQKPEPIKKDIIPAKSETELLKEQVLSLESRIKALEEKK